MEFRIADYREVDGKFDAVSSIAMHEHVGPDHLGDYFAAIHRLVDGGGRFLNSGITTGRRLDVVDMTRQETFAARYVFRMVVSYPPGGSFPHLQRAGFELFDLEQLRRHYALTLRHWVRRLEANRAEATRLVGERTWAPGWPTLRGRSWASSRATSGSSRSWV